jgi:outer membrane protein OmpA-like peptidoglycan-associated protein
MNLFDTLNEALSEDVVSKIAKLTDEEPDKTKKALDGIMYTLIAGLIRRTGSAMSVNMLFNQIQKGSRSGELINAPMSYLEKKDKLEGVLKSGEGLVSQIFPAYKSPLISMIGTYAGIKKNSSTMYSAFMAPVLIDAVGKEINDKKFDVDGLVSYMLDHHEPLLEKAPEDLMEKMIPSLGLQELTSGKFSMNKRAAILTNTKIQKVKPVSSLDKAEERIEEETTGGGSPISLKWLIGLLVGALLIAGGVYYYLNFYQKSTDNEEEIQQVMSTDSINTVPVDTTTVKALQDSVKKDTLTTALPVPPVLGDEYSSFGTNLSTYLADASKKAGEVVPMSNIKFVAGTANPDPDSDLIISELADLMQKFPKSQVQLQGHAIDAGAKNTVIAMRRAFAIKTALEKKGVEPKRIDAVGSGNKENKVDVKIVSK